MTAIYSTEQELVDIFLEQLMDGGPWATSKFVTEFNYMRGRTDVVAISTLNEVIAIEAKLTKWRNALQQAYRNRCFADKSYVLLPYKIARIANSYEGEFDKRGVGICSIQNGNITILKEAITDEPIQPWLRELAIQCAFKEG